MTVQLTETWTGTDGSAWPGTRWTTSSAGGTGGIADILANQGRLRTGTTALTSSERAVSTLGTALADMEVLVLTVPPSSGDMGSAVVGARCGNTWNGPYPANGYYVEHEPSGAIHTPAGTARYTVYKQVTSTPTVLATVLRTFLPGQPFWTRLRVKGTTISYKVWDQNVNEPAAWDGTVTDSSISSAGNAVLAAQNSTGASVTYLFDNLTVSDVAAAIGTVSGMPANGASQLATSVTGTATVSNDETRTLGAVPNGELEVQFSKTNAFAAGDILADLVSQPVAPGSQASVTLNLFQAVPSAPILVNVGHASGNVTDPQGFVWTQDAGNTGGSIFIGTVAPISPTRNVDIEERYGMTSYAVSVPAAGSYVIRLHLGPDPSFTQPGQRLFNVTVQGVQVLTNFDLVATVGQYVTYVWQGKVTVDTSKTITVGFTDIVDHAAVSGIEVYQDTTLPQNQYPPVVVTPSPQVGLVARADVGAWTGTPDPTLTVQWQRVVAGLATDVSGATARTYTPVNADIGARLQVKVTGTNTAGTFVAVSSPSAVVPTPQAVGGGKTGGPYDTAMSAFTGLTLWLLLNETGGTVAADQSTAQLNGTYPSDATFGAADALAGTGNETGAVTLKSSVTVAHDTRLNLATTATAKWTVMCDVSVSTISGYPMLIGKGDATADTNGWQVFYDPTLIGLGFKINGHSYAFSLSSPLTSMQQVAVTWDGTTLTFTINGTVASTQTGIFSTSVNDTGPLYVGSAGMTIAKAVVATSNNQSQLSNVYTTLVGTQSAVGALPAAPKPGFTAGGSSWSQGGRVVASTDFTSSTLPPLFGAGIRLNSYPGAPAGYCAQSEAVFNVPGVYAPEEVIIDQGSAPSVVTLHMDYVPAGFTGPSGNNPAHYKTAAVCTWPSGLNGVTGPGSASVGFAFQAGATDVCFEWTCSMPQEQFSSWQGAWLVDDIWKWEVDLTESVGDSVPRAVRSTTHYSNSGGSAGDAYYTAGDWGTQPQPGTLHTYTAFVHKDGSAQIYMDGALMASLPAVPTQSRWMCFIQQYGLAQVPTQVPDSQYLGYWIAWQPTSTPAGTGIIGGGNY